MDNGKLIIDNSHWSKQRYQAHKDSDIEWLGEIPEHWQITKIKNVFQYFGSGSTPESSETKYYEEGSINWLNTTDIKNTFINETSRKITELALKEKSLKIYPINTLAIAMYGQGDTRGNVGLLNIESTTNQAACLMYSTRNSITQYMLWWFICKKSNIRKINIGATQPNMNQDFIRNLFISLPSLAEQKQIANYLDRKTAQIDRKIDLLTQKANKYEELKKSLINETVTRGLDKSVAMKDSGIEWIGKIPEHWEVKHFKQFSTMKGRIGWQGLRHSEFIDEGAFLITGMNFKSGQINWDEVYHISDERYEQAPEIQLKNNDILMTKDGTIGKLLYVDNIPAPHKASLNSHLLVFRPISNSYHPRYLYYQLDSSSFKDYIEIAKTGTTFFGISQAAVGRYIGILPPLSEQKAIACYLDGKTAHCDKIITTINQQIEKLKELRKTLINDVVTGKIKIIEN